MKAKMCQQCRKKEAKRKYCGSTCRQRAHRAKQPKMKAYTKHCKWCTRIFWATCVSHIWKDFCGDACRQASWRFENGQGLIGTKLCEHCEKQYEPSRKDQKYCKPTCRKAAWRRRQ